MTLIANILTVATAAAPKTKNIGVRGTDWAFSKILRATLHNDRHVDTQVLQNSLLCHHRPSLLTCASQVTLIIKSKPINDTFAEELPSPEVSGVKMKYQDF